MIVAVVGGGSLIIGNIRVQRSILWRATSTRRWLSGSSESTTASITAWDARVSSWRRSRVRTAGSLCIDNSPMAASLPDGSRVRRESHARFCERLEVKSLRPTHPTIRRPAGSGPMCGRTGPRVGLRRRRRSITPRATDEANIPRSIWLPWSASCKPITIAASSRCSITPAFCFPMRGGLLGVADIEKTAREGRKGKPVFPIALEAARRLDAFRDRARH